MLARFGIETRSETAPIQRGGWLDALRFIVAFLMVLHHYHLASPVPLNELHPVFDRGYLLTNFFLMDSGYVLMRVYGARVLSGSMGGGAFFARRALRVVPAHVIMSLGLVVLVLAAAAAGLQPRNPEWFRWSEWPAQFFLVQAYGVPGGLGWNAPSWSLSALLGCYVLFPFILRGVVRLSPWTALGLAVVMYAAANAAAWIVLDYPVYQMPLKFGIWRALPLFVLGMLLARFAAQVHIPGRLAGWMGALAAVALAALQWHDRHSLASLALIGLIIVAAGAIPTARNRWVERLALVSFSIFITNEVVRIAWFGVANVLTARLGLSEPVQWALWAMGVGAAVVFAFAFHHLIDMPLQRRLQGDWFPSHRRWGGVAGSAAIP